MSKSNTSGQRLPLAPWPEQNLLALMIIADRPPLSGRCEGPIAQSQYIGISTNPRVGWVEAHQP